MLLIEDIFIFGPIATKSGRPYGVTASSLLPSCRKDPGPPYPKNPTPPRPWTPPLPDLSCHMMVWCDWWGGSKRWVSVYICLRRSKYFGQRSCNNSCEKKKPPVHIFPLVWRRHPFTQETDWVKEFFCHIKIICCPCQKWEQIGSATWFHLKAIWLLRPSHKPKEAGWTGRPSVACSKRILENALCFTASNFYLPVCSRRVNFCKFKKWGEPSKMRSEKWIESWEASRQNWRKHRGEEK